MATQIKSQHDQRRHSTPNESGEVFTDQHGRLWHAEVEISTDSPCSPYSPVGFNPPLKTPQNYMRYVKGQRQRDKSGAPIRRAYDIEIDYDAWITDWTEAGRAWRAEATKAGIKQYGNAWKDMSELPDDIRLLMGKQPGALLPAVQAAKQGQGYVLGKRPFDPQNPNDVELKAILEPHHESLERDWLAEPTPKAKKAKE